ncbi:MAG: glycosyltransferase family 2 protein [Candidatus Omnitrophica bacterium]|nr:glycosyltransferase family 2 protein [Candidatus Omnitrophota bacterium]
METKLKNLSVFFPAYNEQDNIATTVENAFKIIPDFAENFEIIVTDDGSRDKTPDVLAELAKKYSNLRIFTHQHNRGYGAALKTGFANSRYESIFFTDGDGQFNVREIEKLLPLADSCDIVAGFRLKRQDRFHRLLNAHAYNLLVRILFGLKARDIDCAFKLIKRKVIESLELKSDAGFISAEFLIKAKKRGFIIKQVGVTHLPRRAGRATGASFKVIINSFRELFRLWNELR